MATEAVALAQPWTTVVLSSAACTRGHARLVRDRREHRLGFRTPTTIVSPWTAGGLVCSEVFLTSAFRFGIKRSEYPGSGELSLPVTESRLLRALKQVNYNPRADVPVVNEPLPKQ